MELDLDAMKQRQRVSWGLGDYTELSSMLAPAARALADACAVSAGQEVLDVAAGDGNFALACAAEGASVVASDLAPGMVERGRARAQEAGYAIEWVEADAEALPFEDERFDCVGSVFGAVFAPRPEVVAEQLFRVVRPGGTVGLTAWTPGSFTERLLAVTRRYNPRPSGLPGSELWGKEGCVQERLEGHAARVHTEPLSLRWEAPSQEELADRFEQVPMQAAARAAMPPDQYEEMARAQRELIYDETSPEGPAFVDVHYLQIVARKRG
ncbi:MAG TPA: methyltransferase domain-containing protein [Thermoleophilaceae bacterium]|nr:methyltransferase domain-containing protein [Thermoleophilaceae bacterium]